MDGKADKTRKPRGWGCTRKWREKSAPETPCFPRSNGWLAGWLAPKLFFSRVSPSHPHLDEMAREFVKRASRVLFLLLSPPRLPRLLEQQQQQRHRLKHSSVVATKQQQSVSYLCCCVCCSALYNGGRKVLRSVSFPLCFGYTPDGLIM